MAAPVYQNWTAKQRQHTSSVGHEEAQRGLGFAAEISLRLGLNPPQSKPSSKTTSLRQHIVPSVLAGVDLLKPDPRANAILSLLKCDYYGGTETKYKAYQKETQDFQKPRFRSNISSNHTLNLYVPDFRKRRSSLLTAKNLNTPEPKIALPESLYSYYIPTILGFPYFEAPIATPQNCKHF